LFVMSFVVIDLFIAAWVACLCGRLICSARHGTADNDDCHGDDATRLRVFGGVYWASLADVRWGARSRCVRLDLRVCGVRVVGVRVVAGQVGAGGWVGGQLAMQGVVVTLLLLLWRQMCAAAGRRGWAFKLACTFVRTLLAASDVWVVLLFVEIAKAAVAALVCWLCGLWRLNCSLLLWRRACVAG
jgi:hypothetical protein